MLNCFGGSLHSLAAVMIYGALFIVDGAKALSKAIRNTFGVAAAIQRCQVHKGRNIIERLPQHRTRGPLEQSIGAAVLVTLLPKGNRPPSGMGRPGPARMCEYPPVPAWSIP